MVIFTRFRELPDAQMKHIVNYVNSGKPIIGLRTATHAFNYKNNKQSPYAKYSFRDRKWDGGFGRQVFPRHPGDRSQRLGNDLLGVG